jgi:hypothetical protein
MANSLVALDATKFSSKVVANLDKINVMLPLVNREYEGDLTENSTVKIRTMGSVSMGAYSGSISYQDLAPAVEDFTVSDAQYFAFKASDIDRRRSDIDPLDAYAKRAAIKMNDVIEAKILAQYTAVPSANRITGSSAAALALDKTTVYKAFVDARTALSKQNVPLGGRFAVVDSDTFALLLQAPEFVRATAGSDVLVRSGLVGQIAGFDIYESQSVPVASGAKYILCGEQDAIFYAGQIMEVETVRLETSFDTAVRGLLLHDATVVAENAKRLSYIKATA